MKVLLTVIAVCLVWICVWDVVVVGTVDVNVVDWPGPDGTQDVNIVGIEIGRLDSPFFGGEFATALPVKVTNWP